MVESSDDENVSPNRKPPSPVKSRRPLASNLVLNATRDGLLAFTGLAVVITGSWWLYSTMVSRPGLAGIQTTDPRAPTIFVDDATLDLGDVALDDGEVLPVAFRYENRGASPLTIHEVATTCSCASATASRKVVPPGEFGEIKVQIKRSTLGRGSAVLIIASNDPAAGKLQLKCHWNGIARLQFVPPAMHFGDVLPGSIGERELILRFTDQKRFPTCQVVSFELSPGLEVKPQASNKLDAPLANETRFHVALQAGRQLGESHGRIRCQFQGCFKDEFLIPVSWTVRSRVQATPQQLYLQTGRPGDTLKKKLVVTVTSPDKLSIQSVQLRPAGIGTATLRRISEICQEVEVRVPLTNATTLLQGVVVLDCLEPVRETLEIPWSGVMLPPK